MKIKAKLGMSRAGTGVDSFICMEMEDSTSGVRFAKIKIPMEAFAYLISGMYGIEADCELRGLDVIGKVQEHKVELIETPNNIPYKEQNNPELIKDILSSYEVDGWKAYVPDLFNHHRREYDDTTSYQSVSFHRYIDAEVDNA